MRKFIVLFAVLVLLGLSTTSAYASGSPVEYTWTLSALGQGGWIGGPLFADGSAGGGGAFSAANGQILARFEAVSWSEDANGDISVCISVTILKGPADALPPLFCTEPSPVTGTATKMIIFGSPHIFRITETGQAE